MLVNMVNLHDQLSGFIITSSSDILRKNTKVYLKYIYFVPSILQIHLNIYVLNKNTLQLYFWYAKLVYLKSVKLEQLILCLTYCNCAEVVLRSN